jgi:hypothetical protein
MLTKRWNDIFSREERNLDIDWRESMFREEMVTLEPPFGFVLDHTPKDTEIETPLVTLTVKSGVESDRVVLTRSLRARRGHYERDVYPSVKHALDVMRSVRGEFVSFKRAESRAH